MGIVDGLLCRGERIVIPNGELDRDGGKIRDWVVELGHEGHQGIGGVKRLLRLRLWFPGMDEKVERRAEGCIKCQAATKVVRRDPLQPTTAPEEPWQDLAADHWGPTRDGKHLLVLIDKLSKYVEVEVVSGTSAEANIRAFDNTFSCHGNPKHLLSDNGAPFNGGPSHMLQQYFRQEGIEHKPNASAEDPEANGLAEAFMKHAKKVWHTSIIAHKDPYIELNRHLKMYRATPHPSTGKSPAELLFNRKFQTKIPDIRTNPAAGRPDIQQARDNDKAAKLKQKKYKDAKATVRPHNITTGDTVLLERKSSKHVSPYDPEPFRVTTVHGKQITGQRGENVKVRDSQKWKKIVAASKQQFHRRNTEAREDADIGVPIPYKHSQVTSDAPRETEEGPVTGAQEEIDVQAEPSGTVRPRSRRKEKWSFESPTTWQPSAQSRPMTRSVSARREMEKGRIRGRDR